MPLCNGFNATALLQWPCCNSFIAIASLQLARCNDLVAIVFAFLVRLCLQTKLPIPENINPSSRASNAMKVKHYELFMIATSK